MPDFTFQGHAAGMYPMLRDVYDQPAGTVTPGDVLRLHEAPDQDWVPCEEQAPDSGDAGCEPARPSSPPQATPAAEPASQPTAGVTGSEEQ